MEKEKTLLYNPCFKDDVILTRRIEEIGRKYNLTKEQAHALLRIWFVKAKEQISTSDREDLNSSLMTRLVIPSFGKFVPDIPNLKRYWKQFNIPIDTTNMQKRIYG